MDSRDLHHYNIYFVDMTLRMLDLSNNFDVMLEEIQLYYNLIQIATLSKQVYLP